MCSRPGSFDFAVYGRDRGEISRTAEGIYTVNPDEVNAAPTFSFADRDFHQRSLRGNAVLRWEYRPGSALFVVWQQRRFESLPSGEFSASRDLGDLLSVKPENVFVVKATWWLAR